MEIEPMTDDEYIAKLRNGLLSAVRDNSGKMGMARNYGELIENHNAGKVSAVLSMEDGRAVSGKIEKLNEFYKMGFRAISLTWNAENCLGFPNSRDESIMSKGLKPFGFEAVERMNELGILVDVSHLSDGGFMDVAKISRKPFIASHSNARAVAPHPRNLSDEMIRILSKAGGVMGLNFFPEILTKDSNNTESRVEWICEHAKHIKNVGGTDCIGIGTDFDGIRGKLEIEDASKMQMLFAGLKKAGFTEDEIDKLAFRNVLRVIRESL